MQMSEELDKLKSLQEVLAEKYEIEAKVEELPKTLDGSTESLERFKKEYIEKNSEYEAEKAKVAELRTQLDEAQKLREEGEKGMDSITTHREYEILDKQINEAQEKENSIRKELQKEEKVLAELNDILKSEEELIASTEKDVQDSKENLDKEIDSYKEKLASLSAQEEQMSEGIDAETIIKFQRIIRRNHKGIVAVKGNVCDGCHMILPAQFANEVHRGTKILFCPYCSRILYYEESEAGASNYFTLDDAGSLSDLDDEDLLDEDGIDSMSDEDDDSSDVKLMDFDD